MSKQPKWYDSRWYNWVGTLVSLAMTLLYVQRWLGSDPRPSTPYVLTVWGLMFITFLGTAVYKTWFKN